MRSGKMAAAIIIGSTLTAAFTSGAEVALLALFASVAVVGFSAAFLGVADDLDRGYAPDGETMATIVAMVVAFAIGALFASVNGASETLMLAVAFAASGAALVAIIVALFVNDWRREHAAKDRMMRW